MLRNMFIVIYHTFSNPVKSLKTTHRSSYQVSQDVVVALRILALLNNLKETIRGEGIKSITETTLDVP